MSVSFVIPLYNCLPLTQAMLASLQASLPVGLDHEIILVDDGSTDGTRDWLATLGGRCRVLLNERNLGYAGANNRGVAAATKDVVALLNNDLVLPPRWLEPMLAVHRRLGDRAGLVGNVQVDARTGQVDHAGIFINLKGKPEHDRREAQGWSTLLHGYHAVDALTGACLLLSRATWHRLGAFDAWTAGLEYGCRLGEGKRLTARVEYYWQVGDGHPPTLCCKSSRGGRGDARPSTCRKQHLAVEPHCTPPGSGFTRRAYLTNVDSRA